MSMVEPNGTALLVEKVWNEKYRYRKPDGTTEENTKEDTHKRVVEGIYRLDPNKQEKAAAFRSLRDGIFAPAGRIHAGAGTDKAVTLINCFVAPRIGDSMRSNERDGVGIMDALAIAAYTQQMGGGIGMDFSTLRPRGAIVRRTGSVSDGPLCFMDMWDSMCKTVMSSGSRRGAMMATMCCTHPNVLEFITAKRKAGRLLNFNVSVLISDDFMDAVKNDEAWHLYFNVPPADMSACQGVLHKEGETLYIYETVRARDLWDRIIESTYEYAEPGVIFIDRINKWNNLWYCEDIRSTNPCGEQPLPPNGACNLGAINLASLVTRPFTDHAKVQLSTLRKNVRVATRFLDNVLDVSEYPTELQQQESWNKRRLGLGVTGLANMFQQMQVRYGSQESLELTSQVMEVIRDEAYATSIELAKERGPFPMFDRDQYVQGKFIQTLPDNIQDGIYQHGIRNGVLLTIAPTGTTSIYYDYVSSGIEPTFSWKHKRKMLGEDKELHEYDVEDYGYRRYCEKHGEPNGKGLPDYMVTALELPVEDHVRVQAACQVYVDASISKTINCPKEITFEDFKDVYSYAYEHGLKSCTTYRPSDVRGSVLSVEEPKPKKESHQKSQPSSATGPSHPSKLPRPEELSGKTYKVKWTTKGEENYYITLNDAIDEHGVRRPFEIFINSKAVTNREWIDGLCRSVSGIFRRGGDVKFIVQELEQVYSPTGGAWVGQRYVPSLVAMVGHTIAKHMREIGYLHDGEIIAPTPLPENMEVNAVVDEEERQLGEECPTCKRFTYIKQEGCRKCMSCGFSDCG